MKKLKDLPIGALVKDTGTWYFGQPILWRVADKNREGHPANSVTLISDKVICFKAIDAQEPDTPGKSEEKWWGNNIYSLSNIHQWLNSNSHSWYYAQHSYDAPPTKVYESVNGNPYTHESGFLTNFSNSFRRALLETTIRYYYPFSKLSGTSNNLYSTKAKMFLPSMGDMWKWPSGEEDRKLAFFEKYGFRAYPTKKAADSRKNAYETVYCDYWTRTADFNTVCKLHHVVGGNNDYTGVFAAEQDSGIRPMCNLPNNVKVRENPDSDGAYVIEWNQPPSISLNGASNIGLQKNEFAKTYSVTDIENDTVTVTEKLDNKVKKTETVTLGEQRRICVTRDEWIRLTNGNHKLIIEATDSKGAKSTAEYTFTKREDKVVVNLKMKADCDERPTRVLVTPTWQKEGAVVKVEACNNMNDETPTWEDITERTLINKPCFLQNETKTAEKWRVGIKVTMKKNEGYNQEISLLNIGGAYE